MKKDSKIEETPQVLEHSVSGSLPLFDVKELNEIIIEFNSKDTIDLTSFISRVWNKAYTLGCIDGSKSNYR